MIETTCVVMQNDGGPYVADFAVFFFKSLNQLLSKIKSGVLINQSINRVNFKREAFDSSTEKLMTLWPSVRQDLKVKNER